MQTQAAALANPLRNLDDEQIGLALAAVVTSQKIPSARVLDEDGTGMSAAGSVAETASPSELMILSRQIVFDAGAGPKAIGTLEFVAMRQYPWEQTRDRLRFAVTIEVAAALSALRTVIGRPAVAASAGCDPAHGDPARSAGIPVWRG